MNLNKLRKWATIAEIIIEFIPNVITLLFKVATSTKNDTEDSNKNNSTSPNKTL